MEVALWRTPGEKCAKFFDGEVNLRQLPDGLQDDSQLCAGLDQVGKDACQVSMATALTERDRA